MTESREDLEARIAAYIDGQLSASEAARLEVFLANTDPQLAEQIIGMLEDRHRLRTLPKPAAPPDLAARVMEQVERATLLNDVEQFSHPARPWWQSRAVVAAGFILVFGGFSWLVALSIVGPTPHDNQWGGPGAATMSRPLGPVANGPVGNGPVGTPAPAAETAKGGDSIPAPDMTGAAPAARHAADASRDHEERTPEVLEKALQPAGGEMKSGPAPAAADSADKTEVLVQEQLTRNREVAQNGQSNASKLGYTAVNSPQRALSNISAGNSTVAAEPILITFVARDDQDFTRLRLALEEMMNQDPAAAKYQASLQARYITNATAAFNGANGMQFNNADNAFAGRAANNIAPNANALPAASAPAGLNGQAAADNAGYNFYDAKRKEFQYVPESNALASNGKQADAIATTTPAAAPNNDRPTGQNQAAAGAGERQQAQQQQLVQRPPAGWETGVTPLYRVALRTAQVKQLASQFQVDSITSGHQAYVITPEPAGNANVSREDADHAKASYGMASRGAAKKDEAAATPPAPATPPAAAPAATAPSPLTGGEAGRDARPISKAASAASGAPAPENQKSMPGAASSAQPSAAALKDSAWVECVITMQPRPARANNDNAAEPPLTK